MTSVVLILGAKSTEQPLDSVPAELSRINQLFKQSDSNLTTEYEPYLTVAIIGDTLRRVADEVAILHFAGHSSSNQLLMNDDAIYSSQIAGLLKTWNTPPQLVFINGCNSSGQVKLFHEAGVKMVIATHQAIDDKDAARFAYEFYAELLNHPDKTTIKQAFDRSGVTVFMNRPLTPRSLDLEEVSGDSAEWDWGLYSKDARSSFLSLNEIAEPKNATTDDDSVSVLPAERNLNWLAISIVSLLVIGVITAIISWMSPNDISIPETAQDKSDTTNITINSEGNSKPTVLYGNASITNNNTPTIPPDLVEDKKP